MYFSIKPAKIQNIINTGPLNIHNNIIRNNSQNGILDERSEQGTKIIRYNTFTRNGTASLLLQVPQNLCPDSPHLLIEANIIANSSFGILAGVWFRGSIIAQCPSPLFTSSHNDFWANEHVNGPFGTGDISAHPLFVNEAAGNLRLLSGSQALTTGPDGREIGAYGHGGSPVEHVDCSQFSSTDDADSDGISDHDECVAGTDIRNPNDPVSQDPCASASPTMDRDRDGLSDREECQRQSDPDDPASPDPCGIWSDNQDTDRDRVSDKTECATGTDPTNPCDLISPNQDSDRDGLSDFEECFISHFGIDTDHDGLWDSWERNGYDFFVYLPSGTTERRHVDLPGMGASTNRRDIFVHVDWHFAGLGIIHTHEPPWELLEEVVESFEQHDLTLHIERGRAIREEEDVIDRDGELTISPQELSTVQAAFHGDFPEKRLSLRYAIFSHQQCDTHTGVACPDSICACKPFVININPPSHLVSFILNQPSNYVCLGNCFGLRQTIRRLDCERWYPYDTYITGTFMHELGHTLGLCGDNCGRCSPSDCNPADTTVMHYNHQQGISSPSSPRGYRFDYAPHEWQIVHRSLRTTCIGGVALIDGIAGRGILEELASLPSIEPDELSTEELLKISGNPFGDLNNDRRVDIMDFLQFRRAFGSCVGRSSYLPMADYNLNGCIDFRDYQIWFEAFVSR